MLKINVQRLKNCLRVVLCAIIENLKKKAYSKNFFQNLTFKNQKIKITFKNQIFKNQKSNLTFKNQNQLSKINYLISINQILISQVCFLYYIIFFEARKCMRRLQKYVSAPLCPCTLMSLHPYVCALMSCALLSEPLCRRSARYYRITNNTW